MKSLYVVRKRATGKEVGATMAIGTKDLAKSLRDILNGDAGYSPTPEQKAAGNAMPFFVSYGKDHWRYSA